MRTSIAALVACLAVLVAPAAAPAQTTLERLEALMRQKLGQGSANPAPAQPKPATSSQPADSAAPAKAQGKPWLGLVADDESDRGRGVRVQEVSPDGPAAKAGCRPKDLIVSLGGMRIRQMSDLADLLELYGPGDSVAIEILRDDKPTKLQVTLGAKSGEVQPSPAQPTRKAEEPLILLPPGTAPTPPPAPAPSLPPPPLPAPPSTPVPDAAPAAGARIDALERRIEQLERRIAELERALKQPSKPAK